MNWSIPVAIRVKDMFYTVRNPGQAEFIMLKYWPLFSRCDLQNMIMACLCSHAADPVLQQNARHYFVEGCKNAGILVSAVIMEQKPSQHRIRARIALAAAPVV
jgi:hypothetical protein